MISSPRSFALSILALTPPSFGEERDRRALVWWKRMISIRQSPRPSRTFSTRAFVGTGTDVLIGGIIIGDGDDPHATVLIRALGPSLTDLGVGQCRSQIRLLNCTTRMAISSQATMTGNQHRNRKIAATGLAPSKDKESALLATVASGNYTVVVLGVDSECGQSGWSRSITSISRPAK